MISFHVDDLSSVLRDIRKDREKFEAFFSSSTYLLMEEKFETLSPS
nr:hypothetical protein [Candidatus Mycoplasma haematolamae]